MTYSLWGSDVLLLLEFINIVSIPLVVVDDDDDDDDDEWLLWYGWPTKDI